MDLKEKIFKKNKTIFLLEYLVIAVVLLLVGFLRLFDVIPYSDKRLLVYNIVTLIGVAYVFFDTTWYIVSKKKRERSDLIDKIFPLIAAIYLLVFDILVLAKINTELNFIKYSISIVLLCAGAVSLFLGIYHHYKPSKMLLEAVEEEYQEKLKEQEEESNKTSEDNK